MAIRTFEIVKLTRKLTGVVKITKSSIVIIEYTHVILRLMQHVRNILKCNGVHTTSCHRDPLRISLRKFHEDLVDHTKTTQESTDIVLSKCLTQLSTPARLCLPPLDHVKRTIRHHRKENDLPSIPNDVNFPSVPSILKFTKRNELFLRIDTGPGKWYTAHK